MASLLSCGITTNYYDKGIISSVDSMGNRHPGVVTKVAGDEGDYMSGDPRNLSIDNKNALATLVLSYYYTKPIHGYPGSANYGVYTPNVGASWGEAQADPALTGVTNPYGAVKDNDLLYLINYDYDDTTKKANVCSFKAGGAYAQVGCYAYAGEYAAKEYYPHGNGLDTYTPELDPCLVALFNLTNKDYNYMPSALVVLDGNLQEVAGKKRTDLTESANGVTVQVVNNVPYAFVTAFGGMQVVGGNGAKSTLQIVNLNTMDIVQTIPSEAGKGDFVDIAFVGGDAYILRCYCDEYYAYHYTFNCVSAGDLLKGDLGAAFSADASMTGGTAWMLAPYGTDGLWFVCGDDIYTVNTNIGPKPSKWNKDNALTKLADASTGAQGLGIDAVKGHVNTATVAIDQIAAAAPKLKAAAKGGTVRVKASIRVVTPEEWEKKHKK